MEGPSRQHDVLQKEIPPVSLLQSASACAGRAYSPSGECLSISPWRVMGSGIDCFPHKLWQESCFRGWTPDPVISGGTWGPYKWPFKIFKCVPDVIILLLWLITPLFSLDPGGTQLVKPVFSCQFILVTFWVMDKVGP